MFYTGIGSRKTPTHVLGMMTTIASIMSAQGHVLRSGGATGADTAFALGADGNSQIFLARHAQGVEWAMETVDRFHPAPHRLSSYARLLMARNAFQVLGPNGDDPSSLIICWTPNGSGSGGTGQAIRIATAHGIPVYDLGDPLVLAAYERRIALHSTPRP